MQLRPGVRVNRYTLVKPLGEGGQGSVWKVIDPLDGGAVRALKLILVRDLDAAAAERARREARALRRAGHPALVPCRELFEDPAEGLVGLVFDYLRGRPLADLATSPHLSERHRLAVLEQLADALAHVHGLGLVHRDLKPGNVLITEGFWSAPRVPGGVKLLDFGIAAHAGNPQPLTSSGGMIGTGPYLAPELLAADLWAPAPESFARDLFAFGVLAWELLLGAHPTGLSPMSTLQDYQSAYRDAWEGRRPWPPPGLGGAWRAAVAACLTLDPRRRPATGAELLEILRAGRAPSPAMQAGDRISSAALAAATAAHIAPSSAGQAIAATTAPHSTPASAGAAPHATPMPAASMAARPLEATTPMPPGPMAARHLDTTTPMPGPPVRLSQPDVTAPMHAPPMRPSQPEVTTPMPAPPVRPSQPEATVRASSSPVRPVQPEATMPAPPPIARPIRLEATVPAPPPPAPAPAPAPPAPAPAPPAPRTGGRGRWWWLLALIVALGCAAYAAAWFSFAPREGLPPESPAPSAPTLTPPALPTPSPPPPVSATASQPAEPPAPTPCCGKNDTCISGRACGITGKGCKESLPARSWWLRPFGAEDWRDPSRSPKERDLAETHPRGTLCLQRAGAKDPEVCAPMRGVARGGDREHRLRVTSEEIKQGSIKFRFIDEHEKTLIEGNTAPIAWPLKTALCGGLILKVQSHRRTLAHLSLHLDDS